MPENVRALREEVAELKAGTLQLAEQVGHLSGALTAMSQMQVEQQRISERVETVSESTVSKEEAQEQARRHRRELATARHRLVLLAVLVILQLGVVLFVAVSANQFRERTYEVCQARSEQAVRIGQYLDSASAYALTQAKSDAERTAIRRQVEQLKQAFPPVSCSGLR